MRLGKMMMVSMYGNGWVRCSMHTNKGKFKTMNNPHPVKYMHKINETHFRTFELSNWFSFSYKSLKMKLTFNGCKEVLLFHEPWNDQSHLQSYFFKFIAYSENFSCEENRCCDNCHKHTEWKTCMVVDFWTQHTSVLANSPTIFHCRLLWLWLRRSACYHSRRNRIISGLFLSYMKQSVCWFLLWALLCELYYSRLLWRRLLTGTNSRK